jgi:hypothetical protein
MAWIDSSRAKSKRAFDLSARDSPPAIEKNINFSFFLRTDFGGFERQSMTLFPNRGKIGGEFADYCECAG